MKRLFMVLLKYDDGTETAITGQEISRMLEAAEAIDMLKKAKEIAKRLIE